MSTDLEIYEEIKKLTKQGIHPHDPTTFETQPHSAIGVIVETALPEGSESIKPLNWTIEIVNTRGASVFLCDWRVELKDSGQRVLSFVAYMRTPKGFRPGNVRIATSFADFGWYHGNEAIPSDYVPEVVTQVAPGVPYGDLGWYLPCRMADRLVDALGKANEWLLSGILEDSIIYGVLAKEVQA